MGLFDVFKPKKEEKVLPEMPEELARHLAGATDEEKEAMIKFLTEGKPAPAEPVEEPKPAEEKVEEKPEEAPKFAPWGQAPTREVPERAVGQGNSLLERLEANQLDSKEIMENRSQVYEELGRAYGRPQR